MAKTLEILGPSGGVVTRIVADAAFAEAHYPGRWREAPGPLTREAWRQAATVSRAEFCLGLRRAGILSGAEALEAAKGETVGALATLLGTLDPEEAIDVQIAWAAAKEVDRGDPIIAALAAFLELEPEAVDALFGWQEPGA